MAYCGVGGVWNGTACTTDNLYLKGDFQDIVVDGLGTTGAVTVEWLDLIILLVVLGFIIGVFVKLGNMFR